MGQNTKTITTSNVAGKRMKMRSGMTMLELLIVVSIIAMLAALLFAGLTVSYKAVAAARTKSILANCQGVLDEIIAANESLGVEAPNHFYHEDVYVISNPLASGEFNWEDKKLRFTNPDTDPGGAEIWYNADDSETIASIERFVWVAMQNKTSREMLLKLGRRDSAADTKGNLTDVGPKLDDPKPNGFLEIIDGWGMDYIIYVKSVSEVNDSTEQYDVYGFLPDHPQPYFASRGPDGFWGDVNGDTQEKIDSQDNIYSFDLE